MACKGLKRNYERRDIMQEQANKSTFWNKLLVWAEALESTSFGYQQDQLIRLHSELSEVRRRVKIIESGVTTKQESCGE